MGRGKQRVNLGREQDGDVPTACDIGEDLIVVGSEELGYLPDRYDADVGEWCHCVVFMYVSLQKGFAHVRTGLF